LTQEADGFSKRMDYVNNIRQAVMAVPSFQCQCFPFTGAARDNAAPRIEVVVEGQRISVRDETELKIQWLAEQMEAVAHIRYMTESNSPGPHGILVLGQWAVRRDSDQKIAQEAWNDGAVAMYSAILVEISIGEADR
jgi:hypothetical protein